MGHAVSQLLKPTGVIHKQLCFDFLGNLAFSSMGIRRAQHLDMTQLYAQPCGQRLATWSAT